MGFTKTHRHGDTGIGKTLEDLLGIKENNIPLPDIGGVAELKSYRKNAKSMITLFTLEPLPKGGDRDRLLLDNFGYSKRDNNRSKELHGTLSCKRYNNQNLRLSIEKDKIRVKGKGKRINIFWDMKSVRNKFNKRIYISSCMTSQTAGIWPNCWSKMMFRSAGVPVLFPLASPTARWSLPSALPVG
jgi:hypothetical protein